MDAEIVLGTDVATGSPVTLGLRERQQGTYIIGKPGTGKTTLIEHMVVQDIEHGLGVCVLDPHGDLIDAILARVPEAREGDVILLDAADTEFPFGLNLFECRDLADRSLVGRVATQAVEVFEKLWGDTSWGPQLAQVLRNCAYTMVENQGYTLTEIRRLLTDDEFRARLVANLTLPQAREFWELEYNVLPRREQLQRIASTLNKVDEFLTPAIYPIVGFGRTTVDFRQAMDEGNVVLVKLPVGKLGGPQVSLLGSIIVAQIFNAALSRQDLPREGRRQFNLFADEYHRFATPTFGDLLTEARKYGLATTLAHQFRYQLDGTNRGATLTAANLLVFAVGGEDAEELAKQFDRTPPPPDVVGQRPKLTISQDPVNHLARSGHDDPAVRRIVSDALAGWANGVATMDAQDLYSLDWPDEPFHQPYYYTRDSLNSGLAQIGRYLVDVMERRTILGTAEEADQLFEIVEALRGPMCVSRTPRFLVSRNPTLSEDDSRAFRTYLSAVVTLSPGSLLTRLRNEFVETRTKAWGGHPGEVDRLDWHIQWLRELAARLLDAPIRTDSGQWEPIYDRPRSYSDVEAELASELVTLPDFSARVKVRRTSTAVEHVLRIAGPASSREPAPRRTDAIRAIARNAYCSPLQEVLDRIADRVRGTTVSDQAHAQRRVRM